MIIPIDGHSPVLQGDTGNALSILVVDEQKEPVSISGATIAFHMQNVNDLATIKTCTGPWTIDPVNAGRAAYTYQSSDLDTPGDWYLWIKVSVNFKPIHPDDGKGVPKILTVKPLPSGV